MTTRRRAGHLRLRDRRDTHSPHRVICVAIRPSGHAGAGLANGDRAHLPHRLARNHCHRSRTPTYEPIAHAGTRSQPVPVRTIAVTIVMALATILLLLVIRQVSRVLAWMIVAPFFAVALYPVVDWVDRRVTKGRRALSTLLVFLALLVVLSGLVTAFTVPLAREGASFAREFPATLADAKAGRGLCSAPWLRLSPRIFDDAAAWSNASAGRSGVPGDVWRAHACSVPGRVARPSRVRSSRRVSLVDELVEVDGLPGPVDPGVLRGAPVVHESAAIQDPFRGSVRRLGLCVQAVQVEILEGVPDRRAQCGRRDPSAGERLVHGVAHSGRLEGSAHDSTEIHAPDQSSVGLDEEHR